MYPYRLFLDVTLYDIMVAIGVIAAFAVFLLYAEKIKLPKQLQILTLLSALVGVVLGYVSAKLAQSIFFYIENGVFEWRGMTFYGGLIGGAAFFSGAYFLGGYLAFRKSDTPKLHLEYAVRVFGVAICAVTLAHAIGRIGCLTAGCCHGEVFEEKRWYTLPLLRVTKGGRLRRTEYAVPVPMYEAFFLADLFALLSWRVLKGKGDALPLYMILYGVWRFCIEFARADDRGETLFNILSPSQFLALIMILGGAVLFTVYYRKNRKKAI